MACFPGQTISLICHRVTHLIHLFWLITQDDAGTFVAPNTAFGVFGALAGPILVAPPSAAAGAGAASDGSQTSSSWLLLRAVLLRLPAVVLFNWSNLLVFDLANQRLPASAREDAANKPWRPVPRGLLTPDQARRALGAALPLVLALNHALLGTGAETALLCVLTWLYNDLGGGDDGWVQRNAIIAAAFGLYNLGSIRVAVAAPAASSGSGSSGTPFLLPRQQLLLTADGVRWILVVSAVILTTMHVQDLKDQVGDQRRGRRSAPLVLGDGAARWTIALPTGFWSLFCAVFWGGGAVTLLLGTCGVVALGALVAYRCLAYRGVTSDRFTWQLWALWTASLYALPALYHYSHSSG